MTISPAMVGGANPSSQASSARLKSAAAEFEALLIAQMLKDIRESGGESWLGAGSDPSGAHMMGLAEEQMAKALSAQGGLGLSQLAMDGLNK
jgi:Rod binding domain-containing protein